MPKGDVKSRSMMFVWGLAVLVATAPVAAQEANQAAPVLGPPEIQDFKLPAQEPSPSAEPPLLSPPPLVTNNIVSEEKAAPVAGPDQTRLEEPANRLVAPAENDLAVENQITPDENEASPDETADLTEQNNVAPGIPVGAEDTIESRGAEALPSWLSSNNLIMISIGAALTALLALFLWFAFRKGTDEAATEELNELAQLAEPLEEAQAPPIIATTNRQEANSAPNQSMTPALDTGSSDHRPWIELEFTPDKAAATDIATEIQFQLIIRNTGKAPASKVWIQARMFNAADESAIASFFQQPNPIGAVHSRQEVAPGKSGRLQHKVTMPKEHVREILFHGHRIFIPVVAFNVVYEWSDGQRGQTSRSYLVGREIQNMSDKMAPFRLDLGPRIYRSLGQRQTKLTHLV